MLYRLQAVPDTTKYIIQGVCKQDLSLAMGTVLFFYKITNMV